MSEMSIIDVAHIILKKLWLVIVVAAVCAAAGFGYCKVVANPKYQAQASILTSTGAVTSPDVTGRVTANDFSVSLALMPSVVTTLKSNTMIDRVALQLGNEYNRNKILSMISLNNIADTLVVEIKATSNSKEDAVKIVNAFVESVPEYLKGVFPNSFSSELDMADNAIIVSPKTTLTTMLAAFMGAAAVIAVLLILAMLDQTIKGESDFAQHYDIPILGMVPDFENFQKVKGGQQNG